MKLRGRKQQTLLAVLLLNANRVVSVDYLADQLWAKSQPGNPGAVLHVHLSNLRRMLGDNSKGRKIVTADTGYVLRVDPNQIDARTFERLAGEGSAALTRNQPHEAWDLLTASLDLWRGPAFGELAFERFAEAEAMRLEELRTGVIEDRMESALALGHHRRVVAELQSLVGANPLRERLRAQLMIALYRCGRQVDALGVYDRGRRLLVEELGVDPSPMLRSVHEAILQQAAHLDWKPPSIEMLPAPPTEDAERGPGEHGDLIGREKELFHLRERFLEAVSGHPSVVLVEGERGVGKSRLAQAFAHSCGTIAEVVWASCWESGASPVYWPWTQLVRRLLERSEPAPSDAAASPAGVELAAIVPELRPGLPGDAAPGCQENAARFRLYASVVRLLVRVAAHKPLVLVLDDVHWADQPSLELLEFVAAELDLLASQRERASILVLATYCAAEDPDGDLLGASLGGLSRRGMVARVTLESLSLSDVGCLIKAATGEDPSFDSVLAVHDRSAGNPFCIHELIRYLTARGDGPDALAPEVVRSALPPAVREVLTRCLARLPGRVLDLLRVAAVTGPSFSLPVVATASQLDEERVLEILAPALRRSIVEEVPEQISHYRFRQVLVRDTLYAELSYCERRRLHQLVGQTLEGTDNVPVFEIADHFWKAAQAGNVTRALTYVERAADLAMARGAYDQAEAQLERALKLVQCLPGAERSKRELPFQLRLGLLIAMTRGDSDQRVLLAGERARELSTEAGDLEHLLSGLWDLAHFHHATSDLPRARDLGCRSSSQDG